MAAQLIANDVLETFCETLSAKETLQLLAVCKDWSEALKLAFGRSEQPLLFWSRKELQTRQHAEAGILQKDGLGWGQSEASASGAKAVHMSMVSCAQHLMHYLPPRDPVPDTRILHEIEEAMGRQVVELVLAARSSNSWPQDCKGPWGTLLLAMLLCPGGRGADVLMSWLWCASDPAASPRPLLPRGHVREFISALVLVARHREARGGTSSGVCALHDKLLQRFLFEEALTTHNAASRAQSVHEWRRTAVPLPARYAQPPAGGHITTEQMTLIQTAVPCEISKSGSITYRWPLPDVAHRVHAFAGCGKTTALKLFAQAHFKLRILYTAFNRSVIDTAAASFPSNVACMSTHQLAAPAMLRFKHNKKEIGNLSRRDIRELLDRGRSKSVGGWVVEVVKRTVESFLTSDSPEITREHLPSSKSLPPVPQNLMNTPLTTFLPMAQAVWRHVRDLNTQATVPHNGYLKEFVDQHPIPLLKDKLTGAPYDVILIDEAQDINRVTLKLLLHQPGVKILVGDDHQHIYSFNYCCSVMGEDDVVLREVRPEMRIGNTYRLTASFRLGPEVAAAANMVLLRAKGERRQILGLGYKGAVVYAQHSVSRTDAAAIATAAGADAGGVASQQQAAAGQAPAPAAVAALQQLLGAGDEDEYGGDAAGLLLLAGVGNGGIPAGGDGNEDSDDDDVRGDVDAAADTSAFQPVMSILGLPPAKHDPARGSHAFFRQAPMHARSMNVTDKTPVHVDALQTPSGPIVLLPEGPDGKRPTLVYISRTNFAWVRAAVAITAAGYKVYVQGCTGAAGVELFDKIARVFNFRYTPGWRKTEDLSHYTSWNQLTHAVENGMDPELMGAVQFVETHGEKSLKILERVTESMVGTPAQASFVLTTVHKYKGSETPYVQLADDFFEIRDSKPRGASTYEHVEDERNLLYVAVTRAQVALFLNLDMSAAVMDHTRKVPKGTVHVKKLTPEQLQSLPHPLTDPESKRKSWNDVMQQPDWQQQRQQQKQQQQAVQDSADEMDEDGEDLGDHDSDEDKDADEDPQLQGPPMATDGPWFMCPGVGGMCKRPWFRRAVGAKLDVCMRMGEGSGDVMLVCRQCARKTILGDWWGLSVSG